MMHRQSSIQLERKRIVQGIYLDDAYLPEALPGQLPGNDLTGAAILVQQHNL